MGQQHNTHVYNNTGEEIKIALTDTNNRNTTYVLSVQEVVCIPTPHGSNTVSVFKKDKTTSNFMGQAVAAYTNNSDRSFIVKTDSHGHFNIVRAKYGTVRVEDTGLQ